MIPRHPTLKLIESDLYLWREAYEAGTTFISNNLRQFPRETSDAFALRKQIAYCPAFASAAIEEITNSIVHRLTDVTRKGGPKSYQQAVLGNLGGVDYFSSTMLSFISENVLPDLLVAARVGVLVDNFADLGETKNDARTKHPYLQLYRREDILNWEPLVPIDGFNKLYLRDTHYSTDADFPNETVRHYRYYEKTPEGVILRVYSDVDGKDLIKTVFLEIKEIPFVDVGIRHSLMKRVAQHQIALLNIESSDISFIMHANFPLYYEFYHRENEAVFGKPEETAGEKKIEIGAAQGRRFPKGFDPPGYINPSSETLKASMEKQEQIRRDIRALVHLNLATLSPRRQATESKAADDKPLEASLAMIGLKLQSAEAKIAQYWRMFDSEGDEVHVSYPTRYDLLSQEERLAYAKDLLALGKDVPSSTFQRELKIQAITHILGPTVTAEKLNKIVSEIEQAKTVTSDPNVIMSAHKAGLCDDKLAATSLGFPEDSVDQAREDRAARIALTLEAQGGIGNADQNRGAPEFDKGVADESKGEGRGKQDNTNFSGT